MTIFDTYELTSTVFDHPEGSLHEARDRRTNALALLLRPSASLSIEEGRRRLLRESGVLGQLSRVPGVARVQRLCQGSSGDALALRYFPGKTLTDRLKSGRPDLGQVLEWALKMAEVVDGVHRAGFLHRNLHPGAFLISPQGEDLLLHDFSLATPAVEDRRSGGGPDLVRDWTCLAPEQTGRLHLPLDRRTDFYALGMVLYTLVAGRPAFAVSGPLEAVHAHLAKVPTPPPGCPEALGDIILKLVSKTPDQRYQSVTGLAADLTRCRDQWKKEGGITPFPLASEDLADRLRFGRKLFARDNELLVLREAYDRSLQGSRETVLLAGPSGVGKTALAAEAGSWVLADQGFFLTGKYGYSQREQPYSALVQQIEDLVDQLLRRSDLDRWSRLFAETLKDNQGVMTALVPAFEAVTGPQPQPPPLPPRETENRFFYTIDTFLRVLKTAGRSVVLFFDDLQWLDPASARLLEYLQAQTDDGNLLTLYSYRTNEVLPSPAFPPFLDQLKATTKHPVLTLGPFDQTTVGEWVTETLGAEARDQGALAEALFAKTAGSPFFLSQLIRRLHREEVLWYDRTARRWDWNSAALRALPASENVSDLLLAQFQTLPPPAARLLGIAACLGSTVHSPDLAAFSEEVPDLAEALWPLIDLQYLVPLSDGYLALGTPEYQGRTIEVPLFSVRFQHDRILHGAYEQIEPEVRAVWHLKAARALEETKPIEAAGHYLAVLDKLTDPADRDRLTRLLVRVGEETRRSSATRQALDFFRQASTLAGADRLTPEERLRLSTLLAETAYLAHEIDEAEAVCARLLESVETPAQKAEILAMQMDAYTFLGRMSEALARGQKALGLVKTSLPLQPNPLALASALIRVLVKARRQSTERLFDRKGDVPETVRTQLRILSKFLVPAQMSGNVNLFVLSTLMTAELALGYGNSEETSGAFGNFAILLSVLGRHRQAFDFASLALRLEAQMPNPQSGARVHAAFSLFALPWSRPWSEVPLAALRGADVALRYGDLFYVAYQNLFALVFSPPPSLEETQGRLKKTMSTISATRQDDARLGATMALQRWKAIAGDLENPFELSEPGFDEASLVQIWEAKKNASGLAVYHLYKTQVLSHFDRHDEAWNRWCQIAPYSQSILGSAYMEEYAVYTVVVCAEQAGKGGAGMARKNLAKERRRLASWARTCPENFEALAAFAAAEEQAAKGRFASAAREWGRSVALAGSESALHVRWKALIFERAAQFHLKHGDKILGTYLLEDAYRHYAVWGAKAKLRLLEKTPPSFVGAAKTQAQRPSVNGDADSLWKVSQVISREIDVDRLLPVVVQAVIENAGARKGWLLLRGRNGWEVVARGDADGGAQAFAERVSPQSEGIPLPLLEETKDQGLLIPSAVRDPRFSSDPLVVARNIRSVLTLRFSPPGSQLQALWYLENDLVERAFAADRLEGLRLLSGQIGISLENARMYRALTDLNRDLEGKVQERTAELEEKNRQFLHSVEYAAVLQRSLLPRDWARSAADRFALWVPKDIVGGDLYWYRETQESCLVALVDCTGHGVPGSLITMLVHSSLDEAWTSTGPGDLQAFLAKTNSHFRRTLGQDRPGGESNDGFDIGLLWWNPQGGPLRYVGARISLVHSAGPSLTWVPGGRKGAGYQETPEPFESQVHTVPRVPGARYYLSSDGYWGQVGGPKNISLGRERFTALLARTETLSMANQKEELLTAFQEYRDKRPQADDITVLGVQIE